MNIALVAHDMKKELMVQFCIAYRGILSKHTLFATATTGRLVGESCGLPVRKFLSGPQGGEQQICARISCNEIDLLIIFRNPSASGAHEADSLLLRECDKNNVPLATNIATAEVLIHGLERGDLDWRDIVNPKK